MKVSLPWLGTFFATSLPSSSEIAEQLTFHAFEIEDAAGDMLDVKVLPNRAADCLSHRGIAKELSAILGRPLTADPLRSPTPAAQATSSLAVEIEDSQQCRRYMGALVKGVTVGPSPAWLVKALESVGQRSINNVVDATNYVMLNIGQPLHAFDAAKLAGKEGRYAISVRGAKVGENIMTLTGEEYELPEGALLIVDAQRNVPIGIAGVKGGRMAEVTNTTTDLIIEAASFDGASVRRTTQAIALFTDASTRFQNNPSPHLAAFGMRDALALITKVAGGEVVGVVDEYPAPPPPHTPVTVALDRVNGLLGSHLTKEDVLRSIERLGLSTTVDGESIIVTPPFERMDLAIPEDVVEEVGRLIGYDQVPALELSRFAGTVDQNRFRGIERMRDELVERGFIEVSTQTFASVGAVTLANPFDKGKPALRTSLEGNLSEALKKARLYAPLVLPPSESPKLFEVGTVFPEDGEHLELRMTEPVAEWGAHTSDNLSQAKDLEEYGADYTPRTVSLGSFKPFSVYPFIARDIALWVPFDTDASTVEKILRKNAGDLLVRIDLFDSFEKEGRRSLAFRLIFQSMERTLTDEEANAAMGEVSKATVKVGYTVR